MNTNMEALRPVEQDHFRFSKFSGRFAAATRGILLLAVIFLIADPRANAATAVAKADKNFMLAAGQVNLTEIKLGEYAAQNGKRDDVKTFGQRMVKDHTAINDDLKALAAQKNVTLPNSLDAAHQKMVDKLMALSGAEFDKAYIAGMYNGHKKAIKAFKAGSAETKDADIKSFADKSAPVLEEHLKLITAIKKS
ncbi:MAG TPA: DUF4142 domain-containing protein [Verrucomicrobiae bacterium]|nr:DUF4142 domain-containing protein [Verrucomicrobiae bacterium]